jgi:hypothetical protein
MIGVIILRAGIINLLHYMFRLLPINDHDIVMRGNEYRWDLVWKLGLLTTTVHDS